MAHFQRDSCPRCIRPQHVKNFADYTPIINPMGATRQQGHKSLRHLIADIQSQAASLFACSAAQAQGMSCIVGILGLAARSVTGEQVLQLSAIDQCAKRARG